MVYDEDYYPKMSVSELEYLRFAYACLDMSLKISIQNYFPGDPPKKYFIHVCQNCHTHIAQFMCNEPSCGKLICRHCSAQCLKNKKTLCTEHADKCYMCKIGCACVSCRVYITDYICNTCSENDEISYTCGCLVSDKNDRCVHCDRKMDFRTKERNV